MATALNRFMETMMSPPQPLASASAVALARDRYGLNVQAARMTGERDENFRLSTADGAEYVLKIAHPSEDPTVAELLTAVLLHLERTDPTLPCPRVLPSRSGDALVHFVDASGRARTARLLTYLPGTLLGSAARSRQQRRSCGRIAGRLSAVLRAFRHPAAQRDLIWDVRHAAQLGRLLDELPDFPHREAAAELLDRLVPRIEADFPRLRHQVVHNDINPLNVLVEPTDETRVVGIIDFGDLTDTALIADVAVAAAEQIPADCRDDVAQARAAVIDIASAYHDSVPLLAQELEMLGTLAAARLVANLVVHEWHVYRNPASGHFAPLGRDFIGMRLALARQLSREEFEL